MTVMMLFGWLVGLVVFPYWINSGSDVSSTFMYLISFYLPNDPMTCRLLFLSYRGSNKDLCLPKVILLMFRQSAKAELPVAMGEGLRLRDERTWSWPPNFHQDIQREKLEAKQSRALPRHPREESYRKPAFSSCFLTCSHHDMRKTIFPSKTCYEDWLDTRGKVLWRAVMEETPCVCVWLDSRGTSDSAQGHWMDLLWWLGCFVWERNCFPKHVSWKGCQNRQALLHTQASLPSAWPSRKEKETHTVSSATGWSMKCWRVLRHQSVPLEKTITKCFRTWLQHVHFIGREEEDEISGRDTVSNHRIRMEGASQDT